MTEEDIGKIASTDIGAVLKNFEVAAATLDAAGIDVGPNWWEYPDATRDMGYLKTIPEYRGALKMLSTYTVGLGLETSIKNQIDLDAITGMGEDSYQSIFWNMQFLKLGQGDSMSEIIETKEGDFSNLKPLDIDNMRTNFSSQGIINGYVQQVGTKMRALRPNQVLHMMNDRLANEMHGQAVLQACKFIIDAKNEAMADERMIKHRERALGIIKIDSSNDTIINKILRKYESSIKTGDLIAVQDGVDFLPLPITSTQRLEWLRYLDNFFYQAVGVPKAVANPEGLNEANSKIGFLSFEPVYVREQTLFESDLWNQLAMRVKFRRPPSIGGLLQENEAKNTGQVNLQQNEIQPSVGRTE